MGRLKLSQEYFVEIARDEFRFVYDGYLQIEELDALDGNSVTKTRVWEPGGNRLLSTTISGTTYYAMTDGNKNVTEYVDSSGAIYAHFEYSPFGKITSVSGINPETFDFRFSSEYYDSETGLVYYNYRYYSPELGRWMSRDPIEEKGGENLYAMVNNNPINLFDILGLLSKEECAKILKELDDVQKTLDALVNMLANWKSGESWKDYGLRTQANVGGYRSDDFSKLSQTHQDIVNEIESDTALWIGHGLMMGIIGGVGYYTLGLHGLIHDTTEEEQWWTVHITVEISRKKLVQERLKKAYDEGCKEYGDENVTSKQSSQATN